MGNVIQIIFFELTMVVIIMLAVKEFKNLKELNSDFVCDNCKTLNKVIYKNCKCEKCHRKLNGVVNNWEHFLIFRVNKLDTKYTSTTYKYKDYLKPIKLEFTVLIIGFLANMIVVVLNIIELIGVK